ncbi:aromatic compound dioxygenase [Aspergillus sclerotioniger CBS 115572]|uniref:Aromatic compound dioxygenase n=1 Tax=Aspergillus sclerotioniger CBS 115572 TaxID=1450535 RepID=A0A317VQB5_9EURO|nr:aromatic compound dioxygenase [Aspergillus sclerotioniger CBS 115572]PWY75247.1 aromatic compound dioxygenase [Aspergillus sclerotioniger CBS 115572]
MHFSKLLTLTAATLAFAHPGEKHDHDAVKREIHLRDALAARAKQGVDACSNTQQAKQVQQRTISRRANTARELRSKRGITAASHKWRRNLAALEKWEAINHNKTGLVDFSPATSEADIFGANTSSILTPTITDGPYYVWGEVIRQNVVEEEYCDGVNVFLEVQYIDVNTCLPVQGALVDIWNANATGVYSGISTSGNYAADGWDSTYLRGIQETDEDGVVTFSTIFPGHYDGRATHTHLLTHLNSTINRNNGTLEVGTGSVAHIGQLFWNEVLRTAVENTYPYTTNTQDVTSNADDMWSVLQASSNYDPFPEFLYLGDRIEDGLFAWIQIGINTTADYTDNSYYSIAAYYDENGGHENSDSAAMGGGGGSGGAPSGAMSSGAAPTGAMPSASASA